jgi:hypothetical protein
MLSLANSSLLGLMRNYFAICLVCSGVIGGCTHGPQDASPDLSTLGDHIARTICPGPPKDVERVANRYTPGQVDRLETRECAEGSSTMYVVQTASNPIELAVAASVNAPFAGLPSYLEIGQPIQPALAILGEFQSSAAGSVTYDLGMDGTDTITLLFTKGHITSIQWTWYLD